MKKWHIHVCTPWGLCHMDGFRLNIRTPWRFIIIALNPAAKVADTDNERWIDIHRV